MTELKNFSLAFGKKKVFQNINFNPVSKEKTMVIGNNASGKTTLALFLSGIIPDFMPANISGHAILPKKVSLLMQNPSNQFFALTVKEELGQKGIALAKKLGAGHLLEKNVFELSEGEKQKINLISGLALDPEILILDEPLELLDPFEERRFKQIICGLRKKTVLWLEKSPETGLKMKKFFLSRPKTIVFPKKKKKASGKEIFQTDFSVKNNSFELNNIVLNSGQGEKIALIGKNGSGKSTLLKALAGIQKISGKIIAQKPFSFAPQNPSYLFFNETVEAELADGKNARNLGISELLSMNPDKLSRGQQKLVSIATLKPGTIMLLDEPTTWLDAENKKTVYDFINESPETMVIATHDKRLLDYCDRVFLIEKGGVKECSNTIINRFFQARLK